MCETLEAKLIHSVKKKASSEKNQKRKLKTPDQVKALEKFYSENRQLNEEMRAEIAEQLGLTEKQVCGWFCHRRLKDRRVKEEALANGRQDHSSGIIQDRGSGHMQDSCGSTKQGDHGRVDPREVESRTFHHHYSPAAVFPDQLRYNYVVNVDNTNDASSGSSSHSLERFCSAGTNLKNANIPKYPARNGITATVCARYMFGMGEYKPSGYLKVKCDTENVAIIAVKRQLGRHYREDGPPLGIQFDSLPPGAFESPIRDASPGSYYDEHAAYSPETDGIWRPSSLTTRESLYDQRINSTVALKEAANFSRTSSHDFNDYQSIHYLRQKQSLFYQRGQFSGHDPSSGVLEESSAHVSAHSWKRSYSRGSKDNEGMGPSVCDQFNETSDSDKRGLRFHEPARIYPNNMQVSKKSRVLNLKKKGKFEAEKDEEPYYEEEVENYYHPDEVKKHPNGEIPMAKRVRMVFPLQNYAEEA